MPLPHHGHRASTLNEFGFFPARRPASADSRRPLRRRIRQRPNRPATVWAVAQDDHSDARQIPAWLLNTIVKIVTTYTAPADRLLLLAAPTPRGVGGHGPFALESRESVDGLLSGLLQATGTATRLGRPAQARTAMHAGPTGSVLGLPLTDPESVRHPTHRSAVPEQTAHRPDPDSGSPTEASPDRFDAVIAMVDPRTTDWVQTVPWNALVAPSGILAIITNSDWVGGRWMDPSSLLAKTARRAGLAEIDRIVLLEVPVRDSALTDPASTSSAIYPMAAACGPRHLRIHSDLLIFAQSMPQERDAEEEC